MNKDQMQGKLDQAAGKVKEAVGEGVGNQKLANQGAVQQVKGAAEETWGKFKDAASATANHRHEEAKREANASRHKAVDKVKEVKDNINEKLDAHKKTEEHKRTA